MVWTASYSLPEVTEKIRELMMKKLEEREPPTRIWLTDTVYCGRKKIFRMLNLGRQTFSEVALSRIWLGLIVEAELEKLGVASQVTVEYRGIRGKIDVLADTGEPIEIKTTTSLYTTASDYATAHIEQLSRYCLATSTGTGILIYYVPGIAVSSLPVRRYHFDLDRVREVTDIRIDLLEEAVKEKDPFLLPPTWHSDSFENWECRSCPFLALCRRGSREGVLIV